MKLLLYTDNHFSQYSSILRKRGAAYSARLENQIQCINWVQETAQKYGCSAIYCLGDFFDQNALNAEELTALKEIKWSNIPNYFLVGNHELGTADASFSSAHLLKLLPYAWIVSEPSLFSCGTANVLCIPYLTDRKQLTSYTSNISKDKKLIIFSHNDIKGIQYGAFKSVDGFDIADIETSCSLFINGHLHNYGKICSNGWNLGNLTGQNFGEDATRYKHYVLVLDTETLQMEFIENPNALHFYKLDFTDISSVDKQLDMLQHNSVVTVRCFDNMVESIKQKINCCNNIIESRVLIEPNKTNKEINTIAEIVTIDHREQFKQYVLEKLGSSDIIISELTQVCGG